MEYETPLSDHAYRAFAGYAFENYPLYAPDGMVGMKEFHAMLQVFVHTHLKFPMYCCIKEVKIMDTPSEVFPRYKIRLVMTDI